ncbi:hypothetical protein LCGC14_0387110 [marine sediment metagenome]|uniref:Uncharacterized protein n=1 Tax=marine sediment metagenome TaxID=412755 RepID=A0A0F9W9Q4_9ZZZZ
MDVLAAMNYILVEGVDDHWRTYPENEAVIAMVSAFLEEHQKHKTIAALRQVIERVTGDHIQARMEADALAAEVEELKAKLDAQPRMFSFDPYQEPWENA